MARFKNDYSISKITMSKNIHNLCTIGQDWFTNKITIEFVPSDTIPDYIEVDKALQEYEAKELVIEEVVSGIVEYFKQYNPCYVKVKSCVSDAMHLPVEVESEYRAY